MSSSAQNPTNSKELQDQAAAAALYVTEPQRQVRDTRREANWPLDANGKLTSAGAAASLKRADAKDLPSYPSAGGLAQSAAGGAAQLANQNQKSFEWWKPEANAGASKAAALAKDYKMDPLWQPAASSAGSKAALLAHQKGHGAQFWEPTASDKALIAATGAVSGSKAPKPKTSELGVDRYPDERNAAKNALNAATVVHSNSTRSRNTDLPGLSDEEAARIRKQAMVAGMNAELFGSKPLIGPELDEQKHQAGLHAAAVSMAQGMYGRRDQAYREKMDAAAAGRKAARGSFDDDSDNEETPMSFMGLQETAQKLANERLAKLNDPDEAYRRHWGTHPSPPKNRFSMFSSGSRRGRTDGGDAGGDSDSDVDQKDSRRIRGEMNLFKDKLKEIDERKRKEDRQSLLAAAQAKVKKDLAGMDEDVFQATGKMSPAMRAEWEAKARAKAQAESENRKSNYGKVAIGGGKYLDQTEIDAIAQSRLQPTLDAITAKAEHDREMDEQMRAEEEERKRIERLNKEEEKEKDRQIKAEWKHFRSEEKAERREREAKEKEERRKSKLAAQDAKMQEKFEETLAKEEEEDLKAEQREEQVHEKEAEKEIEQANKEQEKQIKAEWKLFKRQEKKEKEHEKEQREAEKRAEKEQREAEKRTEKEQREAEKQAEKEEAEARKEAEKANKKENRLSSIFRRKSKKEKKGDVSTADEKDEEEVAAEEEKKKQLRDRPIHGTVVPTTTTVITGGAAAGAGAGTVAAAEHESAREEPTSAAIPASAEHHEEPHHNPLMPVEETPEARAANQQKPGGDLIQILKRKKHEHDEKKKEKKAAETEHKSEDASKTSTAGTSLIGKDEPGKAQESTGTPAAAAIAPEHVKQEEEEKKEPVQEDSHKARDAAVVGGAVGAGALAANEYHEHQERPGSEESGQPHAMHALVTSESPASQAPPVAPTAPLQSNPPTETVAPLPSKPPATPAESEPVESGSPTIITTTNTISAKPATPLAPVPTESPVAPIKEEEQPADEEPPTPAFVDALTTPFKRDSVDHAAQEFGAANQQPKSDLSSGIPEEREVVPLPSGTDVIPGTRYGTGHDERVHRRSQEPKSPSGTITAIVSATPAAVAAAEASSPKSATNEQTREAEGEAPHAMGSDRPVSSEIRRSSILDKIEPRVNAGKPGFEGSSKFAALTADMRGTDHAGSEGVEASAAAESEMTQKATAQSANAAPADPPTISAASTSTSGRQQQASAAKSLGAIPTVEGQKHDAPLEQRIGVPSGAEAAALEAVGEKGSHGTPRAKEAKEQRHSSNRLSGFFRSKFSAAGKKLTKEHKAQDGVMVSPTTQETTHGKYVDVNDKHSSTVDAVVPANRKILDGGSSSAAGTDVKGIEVDPAYRDERPVSPLSEDESAPKPVARGRTDLSDEARDVVDDSTLPLPKIPRVADRTDSPVRETRFKEQI